MLTLWMFLFFRWLRLVTWTLTLSPWCHPFDLSGPAKAQRRSGTGYPGPEVLCLWKLRLGAGPGTALVGKGLVASLQSSRQAPAIEVSGMTPIHFRCMFGFLNECLFFFLISMFVVLSCRRYILAVFCFFFFPLTAGEQISLTFGWHLKKKKGLYKQTRCSYVFFLVNH